MPLPAAMNGEAEQTAHWATGRLLTEMEVVLMLTGCDSIQL
jgi:hypothetical protein